MKFECVEDVLFDIDVSGGLMLSQSRCRSCELRI